MIEKALFSRLDNNSAVSALVASRIYPEKIPQSPTYPLIRYSVRDVDQPRAMGSDPAMATKSIQVDCYDSTYTGVKDLADKVRQALQRWSGVTASVTVQGSFLISEIDIFEEEIESYGVSMDFDITFDR